jgi:hypothetical protein
MIAPLRKAMPNSNTAQSNTKIQYTSGIDFESNSTSKSIIKTNTFGHVIDGFVKF